MTETGQNFELTVGDDAGLTLTVIGEAPAIGITEARWGVAQEIGGTPLFTKTLTGGQIAAADSGANTVLSITIDAADTAGLAGGQYHHECEITVGGKTFTVTRGRLTLVSASLT